MHKIEFITVIRHIAWVADKIAAGQDYNEEINEDQHTALMNGIWFMLDQPDVSYNENHENWMRAKYAQGWVYGPVKDFDKKTHPNLRPYDELPEIEKLKDISGATAHRMALDLWKKIYGDDDYV